MDNQKRGIFLITILSLILVILLVVGNIREKQLTNHQSNKNDITTNAFDDGNTATKTSMATSTSSTTLASSTTTEQSLSFFDKLKNKKNVKVLILGDGIALSEGHKTDGGIWDQGVKNMLQTDYGSTVDLTSLAKKKATTADGIDVINSNDISGYDLIITCFGHNDSISKVSVNTFNDNYKNIISSIKTKNPNGSIIAILPSTLSGDSKYSAALKQIATDNGLLLADTKDAFDKSGASESKLVDNGLPNDTGYQYYTLTIQALIKQQISK